MTVSCVNKTTINDITFSDEDIEIISKGIIECARDKSSRLVNELSDLFDPNSFTGTLVQKKGPQALLRYLKQPHKYVVAQISATWVFPSSVNLHGQLGYHACIRLPGNRLCELEKVKDRPWEEISCRLARQEIHYATGAQIEGMWQRHRELIPQYRKWGIPGAQEGLINYRLYSNDCFTYVNRILRDNGQPETQLERTEPYTFASRIIQMITLLTPGAQVPSPDFS